MAAIELYQRHRERFEPATIRRHAERFSGERFKAEISDYITARIAERKTDAKRC